MRFFLPAILLLGLWAAARGETLQQWLAGAPHASIRFTPWDGDQPAIEDSDCQAPEIAQGLYGTLDLSEIPAASFPITVRLLYDTPDNKEIDQGTGGTLSRLKATAELDPHPVIREAVFNHPEDVHVVPVWHRPSPPISPTADRYVTLSESVRVEVIGGSGTLLGRFPIGVAVEDLSWARAVVRNTPEARAALAKAS